MVRATRSARKPPAWTANDSRWRERCLHLAPGQPCSTSLYIRCIHCRIFPGHTCIHFELQLPLFHERCVMLFRYFDAAMPEQQRNAIDGDAFVQQFNRKGVAEHVSMATLWSSIRFSIP